MFDDGSGKACPALFFHCMSALTHFDAQGHAHMVDVAAKPATHRMAIPRGPIDIIPETRALIKTGTARKGDVRGVARIAGIQAAKKTSELIPLCHPLALTRGAIEFDAAAPAPTDARGKARTATQEPGGA